MVGRGEFTTALFFDTVTRTLFDQVKAKYFPNLLGGYEEVQAAFDAIIKDLVVYGLGVRDRMLDELGVSATGENRVDEYIDCAAMACFVVCRQFEISSNHYSTLSQIHVSDDKGQLRTNNSTPVDRGAPNSRLVIQKLLNLSSKICKETDHVPVFLARMAEIGKRVRELKQTVAEVLALAPHDPIAREAAEVEPPKKMKVGRLYVAINFSQAWTKDKIWSFQEVPGYVLEAFVSKSTKAPVELTWKDVQEVIPQSIKARGLVEAMKGTADWKVLLVKGIGGKGKYRLNPKYVKEGIEILEP